MNNGITGKRIKLRSLTRADLPILRQFVNDPEVMRTSNIFQPIDDLRQENWFHKVSQNRESIWFGIMILDAHPPALIGTCCLVSIDWVSRLAELRIRIGKREAWGQGYGTEATQLLIQYGFLDLNLERIWLRVYTSNKHAIKMYRQIGFQQEGQLRRAAYIHGVAEDVLLMGLLRDEWKNNP